MEYLLKRLNIQRKFKTNYLATELLKLIAFHVEGKGGGTIGCAKQEKVSKTMAHGKYWKSCSVMLYFLEQKQKMRNIYRYFQWMELVWFYGFFFNAVLIPPNKHTHTHTWAAVHNKRIPPNPSSDLILLMLKTGSPALRLNRLLSEQQDRGSMSVASAQAALPGRQHHKITPRVELSNRL